MNTHTTDTDYLALEQVDRSSHRLILMLTLAVLGLLGWAALAPLDVVSLTQGSVTPASRVQQVQHLEGGIIREILVREGERVEAGQPLVSLDSTASTADFGEISARVRSLTADLARWEAEATDSTELQLPEDFRTLYPDLVERNRALLSARRGNLRASLAEQEDAIRQRDQDRAEIGARLRNSRARLKLIDEQVAMTEKLLAEELSNRYEYLQLQKEANSLRSRIEEDEAALARAQASLEQARGSLHSIRTQYGQEVQTALMDTRGQLEEARQRLSKQQDSLARTVLRAPMDGIVKSLHLTTEGGVVPAGGTVLELVPENGALIVEVRLPPQEVGHVQVGQSAFVQLSSAEAARLGQIAGTVEHISPDTIVTREGESFYLVRIATQADHFGQGSRTYSLKPGILVTAGIVTGRRTVLAYLLSPLFSTMPFALSER